jgi:hypothetical protein
MTALTKAQLGEITSGNNPTEVDGTLVDVQFNPTSLRVQISNRTAGGQQSGAQARQRPGTGEMQVSFDLVFDTADEGSTESAVSVLEKTKTVERFVRPKGARAGQEAPPRVVFKWGSFIVQGTMESANIDLDLFDAKGVPLRAKVSVSIKGQDPRWTYTAAPAGPGAGTGAAGANAPRPGSGSSLPAGSPGTQGNSRSPDRIVQAMPGESLAQVAARAGFDPAAWRALADGLANPLKLQIGQEVALPASSGKGAATGGSAHSSDPGKAAASLPLVSAAQAPASGGGSNDSARNARDFATDPVRKGQAVASRGGLQGAIAQVKGDAHQQGAGSSLKAFGLASASTAETEDRPWGAGVPLRPRFGSSLAGTRRDPTQAGWVTRPATPPAAGASGAGTSRRSSRTTTARTRYDCGCRGRRIRRGA